MNKYSKILNQLESTQKTWLISGVSGFIGSNILEKLLQLEQRVIGLDNFATGYKKNLDDVRNHVTSSQWSHFKFVEGDICNLKDCQEVCGGVNYVLHQAALGSVPRSINDPITTNSVNIGGFLNMLIASRDANADSFVYAASSSTYGDHPDLPKKESNIGNPLSPYAVTKYVNELYADVVYKAYNFGAIGLRYFNVFGKRQDSNSAYAAVIPKWIAAMLNNDEVVINGDGETSRDFCFIENIVQANILAALSDHDSRNEVYNVAFGGRTSLNQLYEVIKSSLADHDITFTKHPLYGDFRTGDVRHSQADITKAKRLLGYEPEYNIKAGIDKAMPWYIKYLCKE